MMQFQADILNRPVQRNPSVDVAALLWHIWRAAGIQTKRDRRLAPARRIALSRRWQPANALRSTLAGRCGGADII